MTCAIHQRLKRRALCVWLSSISHQQFMKNCHGVQFERLIHQVKVRRSENRVCQCKGQRGGHEASAVFDHPRSPGPLDSGGFTDVVVDSVPRRMHHCICGTFLPLAEAARNDCVRYVCPVAAYGVRLKGVGVCVGGRG